MGFLEDSTFWTAAAVVLFLGFVAYLGVPGLIAKNLDSRADGIRKEIDAARRLRDEADGLLAAYKKNAMSAAKEADGIVAQAREEASRAADEAKRDLAEFVARRRAQAEDRIAQAEAEATKDVRAHVANVAIAAAERFIRERMDETRAANLVDAAILDLPQRLKGRA